jgi:UDP-N-acetyl-D-mannosaminuronic acid dehydrogenase
LKVVVVGLGYVGVPLAACIASEPGFSVTALQRKSSRSGWKIDELNSGESPIGGVEPGLDELVKKVVNKGSLKATDDPRVINEADIILITVQTPVNADKEPDLSNLTRAVEDSGKWLNKDSLLSVESTVPPGTTSDIVKPLLEKNSGLKAGEGFNLVFSFERVTPGHLLHNLRFLPRVVGGLTHHCTLKGINFYRSFCSKVQGTDCLTAETVKVLENAYRDVNIAFANEAAVICEALGVDFYQARDFINDLPNIPGDESSNPVRNIHLPGAGVGGHCLPKDTWLLLHSFNQKVNPISYFSLLLFAPKLNDWMPLHVKDLIREALNEHHISFQRSTVTILGLAYKENTDDPRNSPTFTLTEALLKEGTSVRVHDPYIESFGGLNVYQSLSQAVQGSDCLALVTAHAIYKNLDLGLLKPQMRTPVIIDSRNCFNPELCRGIGFTYKGVGRASSLLKFCKKTKDEPTV